MQLADLRIFTEPQQGASYGDLLAVALRAESLGYGAFFRSDHYLNMGDGDGLPGPTDAWVTLGGIARETSTIRLGTLVTSATFRLPGPLAISVAQVDDMSNGRFATEFNTPFVPREFFTAQAEQVRAACEAIDCNPATMTFSAALVLCCGADEAEFERRATAIGREPAELRQNGAAGTPDEVAQTLRAWADAGAERIYLQVLDLADLDHLDLVATEVAPLLV